MDRVVQNLESTQGQAAEMAETAAMGRKSAKGRGRGKEMAEVALKENPTIRRASSRGQNETFVNSSEIWAAEVFKPSCPLEIAGLLVCFCFFKNQAASYSSTGFFGSANTSNAFGTSQEIPMGRQD